MLKFRPRPFALFRSRRIALSSSGTTVFDNPDSWLFFCDLVFVDLIGTGYSRPVKSEYGGEFYQGRGDAESRRPHAV
jgi:carboxypeptidase C (cathepsin A)